MKLRESAMRQINLIEYRKTDVPIKLSSSERDAIAEGISSITIEPAIGEKDHYHLTPGSTIGGLELENLAVQVQPKLAIDRVLFLMSYSLNPKHWIDVGFDFSEAKSVFESVVPAFVAHVKRAFARGILNGYSSVDETLPTLRGQIRFNDQIRDRYGIYPPLEVRYDEFTEDIIENQLIKAAVEILSRKKIRSQHARRELRSIEFALQNVSSVQFNRNSLPHVTFTRLNQRYEFAINLAKLIIRSASFELMSGRVRATSFLVDMNSVFEDFVVTALRESLKLSSREFPQNAKGKYLKLDQAGAINLKPDISWWQGNRCVFVGDVKYKPINVAGIKHADLYQLLGYTIATNVPEGLLIYAKGEADPAVHEIRMANKRLTVLALDLTGSPEDVLNQIESLGSVIKRQRLGSQNQDFDVSVPNSNELG